MDILKYAIQMELDGEMFYKKQALENEGNALQTVFTSLAKDEKRHAKIIKEKAEGINSPLKEEEVTSIRNVFSNAAKFDFEKNNPKQINAYREALTMEQASIDLYKKLLSESKDNKELFDFLIKQEEVHYKLIEEIIKFVNRPNEWVESAEFGNRKDY